MQRIAVLLALVVATSAFVMPPQMMKTLPKLAARGQVGAGVTSCLMCELMVQLAADPADRDAKKIEQIWNAECEKEFGKYPFLAKDCEAYADRKLDAIIAELESGSAPDEVCTNLKEC